MRVLVVGAGVAGTTAAHALRRAGASVKVVERAPSLAPVGAGITLAPNGLHILHQLGLGPAIAAVSVPNKVVTAYSHEQGGAVLGGVDFSGVEAKFGHALVGLVRSELQDVLHAHLPGDVAVQFDRTVSRVTDSQGAGSPVVVEFSDGSTEETDVVLGADGARSAVSTAVTGSSGASLLRPTGYVCTYGLSSPGSHPAATRGDVVWVYGGGRAWGAWSVPGERAFWFSVHRYGELEGETSGPEAGAWAADASRLPLIRKSFAGLFFPGHKGGFDDILAATDRAATFGLADKASHPFARGRLALLGDAARTVTPWGGQGANQAIEDAAEVANALVPLIRAGGTPPPGSIAAALKGYEGVRRRRSEAVTAFSRQTGALQMARGGLGDGVRRLTLALPPWVTLASLGWLYGHKVQLL